MGMQGQRSGKKPARASEYDTISSNFGKNVSGNFSRDNDRPRESLVERQMRQMTDHQAQMGGDAKKGKCTIF